MSIWMTSNIRVGNIPTPTPTWPQSLMRLRPAWTKSFLLRSWGYSSQPQYFWSFEVGSRLGWAMGMSPTPMLDAIHIEILDYWGWDGNVSNPNIGCHPYEILGYCSPSLVWHVWKTHKKLYYQGVIFSLVWQLM